MKYKALYLATIIAFPCIGVSAQENVKKAFISAPFEILPTLPGSVRLDMIDYYESGLQRPSLSSFGDNVMITRLTDNSLEVQTSNDCKATFYTTTVAKDTVTVIIETVSLPFPDSKVTVYRKDWSKITEIDCGMISEWLNTDGKKSDTLNDVENVIGFFSAEAVFNPDNKILTFRSTIENLTTKEEFPKVSPYIKKERNLLLTDKGLKEIK